jgi:hypothetical protein
MCLPIIVIQGIFSRSIAVAFQHSDQPEKLVLLGSPKSYLWAQKVLAADIHQQLTCISMVQLSYMTVPNYMTQQA